MAIDPRAFRTVLGHFATGVTIVTTRHDGAPLGFTANAFASVSLAPPLVLVCVGLGNASLGAIQASGVFAVNILAADQAETARAFARNGPEKQGLFAVLAHHAATTGAPILNDALAWVDCRLTASYPGGDHLILVGAVQALDSRLADPLLFYSGQYFELPATP